MAKKKRTLEHEFQLYKINHKVSIIQAIMRLDEDEGIEYHTLFNSFRHLLNGDIDERTEKIGEALYSMYDKGDTELPDQLYEMCWDRIKERICDTRSFNYNLDLRE